MTTPTPVEKLFWNGERHISHVVYRSTVYSGYEKDGRYVKSEYIVEPSCEGASWKAHYEDRNGLITFLGIRIDSSSAKRLCEEHYSTH
jgi:hypothetical protein